MEDRAVRTAICQSNRKISKRSLQVLCCTAPRAAQFCSIHTHTHRPMEKAPPEIWHYIFSFACNDLGQTGRSLSLVSRYIHEVSAPMKLQSIAIHGSREIAAFASIMERTAPHLRRVCFLYLNTNEGMEDVSDENGGSDEYREFILTRRAELESQKRTSGLVGEILKAVAGSLEILELDLGCDIREQLHSTHPIHFTRLRDLTTSDTAAFTSHIHNVAGPLFAPCFTLRRLHISGDWSCNGGLDLMSCVSTFAPALTHLQFSSLDHDGDYYHLRNLAVALGPLRGAADPNMTTRLPGSLQRVIVRLWGKTQLRSLRAWLRPDENEEIVRSLCKLETEDNRFTYLKEPYFQRELETRWKRRVDGGDGEWNVAEQASGGHREN